MPLKFKFTLLVLVVFATAGQHLVHAGGGFKANCADDGDTDNFYKTTHSTVKDDPVNADLTYCQARYLEELTGIQTSNPALNDIKVGWKVEGSNNNNKGGCQGGDECMQACQVLCCISDGCAYAVLRKEKKKSGYFNDKVTTKFRCRMYSLIEGYKGADQVSTCEVQSRPNGRPGYQEFCKNNAKNSHYDWGESAYNEMVGEKLKCEKWTQTKNP
eukprot:CAMPEP_0198297458 /NCGR_PEP_ID=MMETSP1449-20131203/36828_1 /TAXON_ID=420275 /ORGANISM="Attheya septentrionalis, Strain CCMP2084" /LENGTH=214 /DNA_ID=CAMNT_0043998379 /DNA_START=68 /DNA_END=712 /DNA_ORIENTATION=+